MTCANFMYILCIFVLLSLVQSKKITCKFEDTRCMTKVGKNVFKTIITGIKCLLEPTDILHVEEIKGEIKSCFKYVLSNATMIGIPDCEITQLTANRESLLFEFGLHCPQLVLNYGFLAKGTLGTVSYNDKGKIIVTLDDYLIQFKGKYGSFISKQDQKLRMYVKSYCVDTELMGNVTIETKELLSEDEGTSETCFNGNVMEMEKCLRPLVMEAFLKVFIDRVNVYFKASPLVDLLTIDEC